MLPRKKTKHLLFACMVGLFAAAATLFSALNQAETESDAFGSAGGTSASANFETVFIAGQSSPTDVVESANFREIGGFLAKFDIAGAGCISDGDVNNDGNLTPGDALCAFKAFLNGQTVSDDCDVSGFACEVIAGDVNCDGTTTPGDALSIFQRFLNGLPPDACFAQGGANIAKRSQRMEPYRLSLGQRTILQSAEANGRDVVKISLAIDNPEGLSSFGLQLSYPATKLDFLGIRRTALTQEWIELDGQENAPGAILIGGFHTEALPPSRTGTLFEAVFVPENQSFSLAEIAISQFVDDFSDAIIQTNGNGMAGVASVPETFKLYQNFPNPFQGNSVQETTIRFDVPGADVVNAEVAIYNITGQLVRRLASGKRSPGAYEIAWDGKDENGVYLPSGVYLYRLKAGKVVQSKRLIIFR